MAAMRVSLRGGLVQGGAGEYGLCVRLGTRFCKDRIAQVVSSWLWKRLPGGWPLTDAV